MRSKPELTTARIIAVLAGLIGVILAVATPLLPVKQAVATIEWPQQDFGSVDAPLISYTPLRLEATVPCTDASGILVSTLPPGAPDIAGRGLVVRADDEQSVEVVLRDQVLGEASTTGACEVTVDSDHARTVVTAGGETNTIEGDVRPQMVGIFTELDQSAPCSSSWRSPSASSR